MMKVRRAVITAAGWGTRFLPITRSQPKEMLPVVDKPLIQYGVEEAIGSGIEQIIMVTSMNKRAIEDYFDRSSDLENFLERKGETALLAQMKRISGMVDICYVRQKEPLGLGQALLTAGKLIDDEPFALILPDDIIESEPPALKKMIAVFSKYQGSVIAVEKISGADTKKYGVIKPEKIAPGIYQVLGLVEKPAPSAAPSRLGIVGRYILTPRIFEMLETTPPGAGGEIQLTDALQSLLKHEKMFAYEVEGVRHDAGTPLGWLKANIALGLKHKSIGPELKKYLKTLGEK
jgi:UTP--glucose-1-phosphate uridylyltransferase